MHPTAVADNGMNTGGGKRIVLTTVGSLGDLHPFLAIAGELARCGHQPVVATSEAFREHVAAAGLCFVRNRAISTEVPSVVGRARYRFHRVRLELRRLLDPAYAERAAVVGKAVRAERGTEAACDAIEAVLHGHPLGHPAAGGVILRVVSATMQSRPENSA